MDDFDKLEDKIKTARGVDEDAIAAQRLRDADNMSKGMRAGTELVASIGGGAFIGWLLDKWLETSPWFLIAMLLLGVITGFVNVYRTTQNIGGTVGFSELHERQKQARTLPDDKESG